MIVISVISSCTGDKCKGQEKENKLGEDVDILSFDQSFMKNSSAIKVEEPITETLDSRAQSSMVFENQSLRST